MKYIELRIHIEDMDSDELNALAEWLKDTLWDDANETDVKVSKITYEIKDEELKQ